MISATNLEALLSCPLSEDGEPIEQICADLTWAGAVGSSVPPARDFTYVKGGSVRAATQAAHLLTDLDRFAARYDGAPGLITVELAALRAVADLLGLNSLDRPLVGGFTSGSTLAQMTALAAAVQELLARQGWDVAARGLAGAPPVEVYVSQTAHVSQLAALGYLGLGRATAHRIPVDEHGRMQVDALADALDDGAGLPLVIAAAGEVNTGSYDLIADIEPLVHRHRGWLHIDGAFGLWAAASPRLRHLAAGVERADSWALDAHKLCVPYTAGIVLTAHPVAHAAAMASQAAYTTVGVSSPQAYQPMDWVPEMSRPALGVPVYAAMRELGRRGVAELVERSHDLACRWADQLAGHPSVRVANRVWLNQVLMDTTVSMSDQQAAALVPAVLGQVRADGVCLVGGTRWGGRTMLRASISHLSTTADDIDMSVDASASAVDTVMAR